MAPSSLTKQSGEAQNDLREAGRQSRHDLLPWPGKEVSLRAGPLRLYSAEMAKAELRESLETEAQALTLYRELLDAVADKSVALEEFARQMIRLEEVHAADVDKMLRKPGDVLSYRNSGKVALP
jgi:bacterioferritin